MFLFGASGHCKVIIDIVEESCDFQIQGIIDDCPKFDTIFNFPVYNAKTIKNFEDKELIIAVGDNEIRKKIVARIPAIYVTAIHPKSIVSIHACIKEGVVVMPGAILNPDCTIGKHCIINSGAVIEHDCSIGDFVHISPNVSLAGGIQVGEGTHIGIGATVIQGIKIGKWVTIGAGSVVLKDIPDYATVVGNPGKIINYKMINE